MEENKTKKMHPALKFFLFFSIMGFALSTLIFGCFYLGAYYSCNESGELIGLKCENVEITEVCNWGDQLYIVNNTNGGFNNGMYP